MIKFGISRKILGRLSLMVSWNNSRRLGAPSIVLSRCFFFPVSLKSASAEFDVM